jgi:GT2 family glycosyltransferase/lipopolysaccharide/colanic/teichoic acid biosynthesis glycosyltransferase
MILSMIKTETESARISPKGIDTAVAYNGRIAHPQLSVIIVSYNVKEFLQQTLISLQKALGAFSYEIFVVDNASDDGSAKLVHEHFSKVKLIRNRENLGFARANNLALKKAKGDYIVLINPDTIAQEDTFHRLIEFMEKTPDAGMVGCKILNPDGSLQLACRRSFPTPWVALTRLIGLSYLFPKSKLFGKYNLTYLPEDAICPVDAISGSFMMLRRQAFEQIGLLDESFFMYGEDLDWCLRAGKAGWKIYYVPTTQIVHFKGESSKNVPFDSLFDFNRAMALFVKKHFRQRYFFITYYLLLLAIWGRAGFSFMKRTLSAALPLIIDSVLLQISLTTAIYIKFGHLQFWQNYLPVNIVYNLAWLMALFLTGAYSHAKYSSFRAGMAVLAGFVFNSALTYFFKQYAFSRAVVLFAGLFNFVLLAGWRFGCKLMNFWGLAPFKGTFGKTLLARRTLVVGDFSKGERILEKLKMRIGAGYEIAGLVSLNSDDVGLEYNGWRVIADVEHVQNTIRQKNIQEVIFSTHRIPYNRVLKIISEGRSSRVNFKLIPSNLDVIIGKASIDQLSEIPLLKIDYKLAHRQQRLFKRILDLILSFFTFVICSPLFAILLLAKFGRLQKKILTVAGSSKQSIAIYEIERAGLIGKLLWLWPVLKGTLSIVGSELTENLPDKASEPHLKPGLTGLVQINRHRNLTEEEKEKFQLFYLTNYSPLLDMEIIFKTLLKR